MQGFNMGRYRPQADLDPSLSGEPVPKKRRGILDKPREPTVRFEMPFAIWCTTCPSTSTSALIGQGVRFNALKKTVGHHLSSPIFSFRMKHTPCGSWIELRTDPSKTDFIVTEGARRRDYGDDAEVAQRDDALLLSRMGPGSGLSEEDEKKRQDALLAFEGKAAKKTKVKSDTARIDELRCLKDRDWRDPDAASKKLRDGFRLGRRARNAEAKEKEGVSERYGLGLDLLDATDADAKKAALVDFGQASELSHQLRLDRRPFLNGASPAVKPRRPDLPKRKLLQEELCRNTRATFDPFASQTTAKPLTRPRLAIKKRDDPKRLAAPSTAGQGDHLRGQTPAALPLVAYDSD